MCGINGIFAYGPGATPVDPAELRRTRDRMRARGPDGAGEYLSADGMLGLGHRRLSIVDLRAVADQPMQDADGALSVVFNGEIYGYRALRAELAADPDFVRSLLRHLFTYAFGRECGPADDDLIDRIMDDLGPRPALRDLVVAVAESPAMRTRGTR